jgi:mRNA-degrading endonuclease YafQ of YafQ-DinJ toxin-antitoxin module
MPQLLTTKSYERQLIKFIRKHPELREHYAKTLKLLEVNPQHPSLRLHKLKGKLQAYSSVSINMKFRIMIDFVINDDVILLISIGSHREQGM